MDHIPYSRSEHCYATEWATAMQLTDPEQLGDEPLYCEADHSSVYYSGSEDDYYEAPETRRLRIETKAVQFLNGNIPYLLSARLQGPFDKNSWNNPWRSKRIQKRADYRGSPPKQLAPTVEATRDDAVEKAVVSDLSGTQRTSLYPLPSPGTTNPPSARKNLFLEDGDYNRIKKWRETVKGISATKDPFWTSHQNASPHISRIKKRAPDEEWLHKRELKKRKSRDMLTSPPTVSPSQGAAKLRSKRSSRRSSLMLRSAPGSSTQEDELAVNLGDGSSSLDTSRLESLPETTAGLSRVVRNSQSSIRRVVYHDPESSEDELSMPSTTPSGRAARSLAGTSISPNNAPSRRKKLAKRAKDLASCDVREQPDEETVELRHPEKYQTSAHQCPALDKPKRPAEDVPKRAHGLSQHDNSFYFHHTRARSFAEKQEPQRLTKHRTSSPAPGRLLLRHEAAAFTTSDADRGCDDHRAEDNQIPVPLHSGDRMIVDTNDTQQESYESMESLGTDDIEHKDNHEDTTETEGKPDSEARSNVVTENQSVDEICVTHAPQIANKPQLGGLDKLIIESNPGESTCNHTEDSSIVSTYDKSQSIQADAAPDGVGTLQQITPVDDVDASDLEWRTYINTQDLSTTSVMTGTECEGMEGVQAVVQGPKDENDSDSDWVTTVDTQDLPTVSPDPNATVENHSSPVVEQGPSETSNPEWLTFLDIQNESATHNQHTGGPVIGQEAMDVDVQTESNSEWSTIMSPSSQLSIEQTGNTSHEPVQPDAPMPNEKATHGSVECIIDDAYTEAPIEVDPSHKETIPIESLRNILVDNSALVKESILEGIQTVKEDNDALIQKTAGVSVSGAQPEYSEKVEAHPNQEKEVSSTNVCVIDETASGPERVQSERLCEGEADGVLQPSEISLKVASTVADSSIMDETNAGIEPQQLQSPWTKEGVLDVQTISTPITYSGTMDETTAIIEPPQIQSPWGGMELLIPATQAAPSNDTPLKLSSSNLITFAGKALVFSETPQTPWVGERLPSPDFSLSVKRFSDFMELSPIKQRASSNGSILRGSNTRSGVLFKTPAPTKPKRCVTFAPLPGAEEANNVEPDGKNDDQAYVEEDVSYSDLEGKKTATVRVTRMTTRAASPPPRDANSAEAGELPDHDHKFSKHFEAMSKRKNAPRETPRLLPSDSQQTDGSQDVAAMAEAFIQASQTRKMGLDQDGAPTEDPIQSCTKSLSAEKHLTSMLGDRLEGQENIEPVDDVSAVLDNLGDFFDSTWGVNVSMDEGLDKEITAQQQAQAASSQDLRQTLDSVGDPMWASNINVWAD